jgi:hypothetical protein
LSAFFDFRGAGVSDDPVATVRFYRDLGGWRFEVDAAHDPVKPWAGGFSDDAWQAAAMAAPYIAHSLHDAEDEWALERMRRERA